MGKDREGNFHPPKGKPSGVNKSEGLGMEPTPPDELDDYNEITDEYIKSPDELTNGVHVRHANRNTSKKEGDPFAKMKESARERDEKERSVSGEFPKITARELPEALSRDSFKELAIFRSDACISIYLNTHKEGIAVNEDHDTTDFKNALNEASRALSQRDISQLTIGHLLSSAFELLNDELFWKNMKKGLAVFISEDSLQFLKMNYDPERKVVVENTFYIIPLLPMVLTDEHYFLLNLSKGGCRLFKGNRFGVENIEINGMPESYRNVVADTGVSTTFRSIGGGASHGAGDGNDNDKVYLSKYLKEVDNAIWDQVLHDQNAPLILAGVEYVVAMYREISKCKNICKEFIPGNHESDSKEILFEFAKRIIEPIRNKFQDSEIKNYGDLSATDKTSDDIEDVICASFYGKIESLFVKKGMQYWGSFDKMKNELTKLDKEDGESEDLVDTAVVNTILHGGNVFVLEQAMPDGKAMAATYRY